MLVKRATGDKLLPETIMIQFTNIYALVGFNVLRKPQRSVWYKTKFGSQNFGYQLWCLFCNECNVFIDLFNVPLIIMWLRESPQLRYELWKFWRATNFGSFSRK